MMLLKCFCLLAVVVLPILLPLNSRGGRGSPEVRGLDQLGWTNVAHQQTRRYWAHLLVAVAVVVLFCYMFYRELRAYIRLRQAYLTSPQHRLRASATTVLVSSIPEKWLTVQALLDLYDVFPGGIRNIWINRYLPLPSLKVPPG
jgi:calcium permeable stress-gated cation channel